MSQPVTKARFAEKNSQPQGRSGGKAKILPGISPPSTGGKTMSGGINRATKPTPQH